MKVAYTGTSDFQEFSAADFEKAGIEDGKKIKFAQGKPTEVDDAIGEALVSKEGFFGDYSFESLDDVEEGDTDAETEENERKAARKAAKKSAKKAAESSDASGAPTSGDVEAQSAGGTPGASGPSSTGRGSSTSGSTSR